MLFRKESIDVQQQKKAWTPSQGTKSQRVKAERDMNLDNYQQVFVFHSSQTSTRCLRAIITSFYHKHLVSQKHHSVLACVLLRLQQERE